MALLVGRGRSPWWTVTQGAAALAAGMGIGRFGYTPILPLMHDQAGLSAGWGASLATANYLGYLAGVLAGTVRPAITYSTAVPRGAMLALIADLALMPATHAAPVWFALRLVAGVASALVFVIAVNAMLAHLRDHGHHLTGWAFGGIGVGIAASGALVLVVRSIADWRTAWWAAAALSAMFTAIAWPLTPEPGTGADAFGPRGRLTTNRWFSALFAGYSLEGVGYIIAGTFLVAAIEQDTPGRLGSGAWVLVGLAALPSAAGWAWLAHRWSRPALLLAALIVQAAGIALPALAGGIVPALVSAVLFGGTFIGISVLALTVGIHLRFPRAVAVLTAAYGVGQILGPLVVTPLLRQGYQQVLLVGSAIVLAAAAVAAGVLRPAPGRRARADQDRREGMTPLLQDLGVTNPVLAAPMAGGPTTPDLVLAAAAAGSLGFLAAGYRAADPVAEQISLMRKVSVPFGVNLFAPNPVPVDPDAFRAYAEVLRPELERFGLAVPHDPAEDDDHWSAKIDLLVADPVPLVTFTFGIPDRSVIAALRKAGSTVGQTVTSPEEALAAVEAGVDLLTVQSSAAGGHSGTLTPARLPAPVPITELVASVRAAVDLPLIAAGGVSSPEQVAAVLAAGADAVAVGTVLLLANESGASEVHRKALAEDRGDPVMTRAFSGRPARGLPNTFIARYDALAPAGYPALHHLTSPLRKAAAAAGDPELVNLWAGTGYRAATAEPAADILTRLASRL